MYYMEYKDDNTLLKSLCGNYDIYKEILEWLKNFDIIAEPKLTNKSCIFIAGISCIGKTYSIKNICKHLNYHIINIDSNNCYNSKQLFDIIDKGITSSLLQIITNSSPKKVILIDNFDAILTGDRTVNSTLLSILTENKYKNTPIICITNYEILKKIGDIKKLCKIYELEIPTDKEISKILKKNKIIKYIKNSNKLSNNGNIFKVINNIDSDNIDKVNDIKYLYNLNYNKDVVYRILLTEQWLIPLRYHENIIIELNNRIIPISKLNNFYKNYMDIIIYYDMFMYNNLCENAIDIFTNQIYNLSKLNYKKKELSTMDNFTKILSYLSLQKKYIKNSYSTDFPLYQIGNYHMNLLSKKFIYFTSI
uniref:ATPase AAA-type core domain-containing protein n=1 Tax=viral metagenome TaxID=1070528 RepID=A0A6C0J377_9ZZZZ